MSLFSSSPRPSVVGFALLLVAGPARAANKGAEVDRGALEDRGDQTAQSVQADMKDEGAQNNKLLPIFETPKKVTGQFEVGLGWLALPTAQVCGAGSCSEGDTTPLIEIWNLVHFDSGLAVGAGLTLGLMPTSTSSQQDDGIDREHSRSYMTFEAIGRYYPLWKNSWDVWIGPGIGLAIVTDRFISNENVSSQIRIQSPGFTLRTEGLSYFVAGGLSYALSKRWHLGGAARVGRFSFPRNPEKSPLGDEASIVGPALYVFAGLSIAVHADL